MDASQKRFLNLVFILPLLFSASLFAAPNKHSFVSRKWVAKLKQDSFFNHHPFQFASPTVDENKIYVGVQRGFFYAIDAKRGKKAWKFRAQGPIEAMARASASAVYFGDMKGIVYALDKTKGTSIWMTKVEGPVMSAPLIVENKIVIVTLTKNLYCLNKEDGKILWQESSGSKEAGFTIHGSADPVLFGTTLLVGYSDGSLVAHSLSDGKIIWSKQLGGTFAEFRDVDSTPFIAKEAAGAVAYVASADGKLFALNPANGQIVWDAPLGGVNDVAVADSFLYVAAEGVLYCLEAKSGKTLWEQDLQVTEISSPAVYKKWLVVSATKGKTFFLDRQTGDILYAWYVRGGSYADPVVDGNQVFILSNAGKLYSFQFKE